MSDHKLALGMLLLGGDHGNAGEPLTTVWTVTSCGERGATILAHRANFNVKARLKSNQLPEGWRIVSNKALARLLARLPQDHVVDGEIGNARAA